jgi:aconitate hydratase
MTAQNMSGALASFETGGGIAKMYRLDYLNRTGIGDVTWLPFSIKVMLEQALRQCDGFEITEADVARLARWDAKNTGGHELPFKPARVILQDFSGEPCLVDLAAMRSAHSPLGD